MCRAAEKILKRFRVDCARGYGDSARVGEGNLDLTKVFGILDREMIGAVLGNRGENESDEMFEAGEQNTARCKRLLATTAWL